MPRNLIFLDKSRSKIIDLVCLISAILTLLSAFIGRDSHAYAISLAGLSAIFIASLVFRLNAKPKFGKFFIPIATTIWIFYMCLCFGKELAHQNYLIIALVAMAIYGKNKKIKIFSVISFVAVAVAINLFQQQNSAIFPLPKYTPFLSTINVINPLVITAVMCWKMVKNVNRSYRIIVKQKSEITASSQFKDKVLSVLGHDMRTPFTSAQSLLMVLENDMLTKDEKQKIIDELKSDIDHSLQTLDNIMHWGSQSYFGNVMKSKTKKETLDISEIISHTIQGFNHLANKKLIQFQNKLPKPTYVYGDQQQLSFVLRNLTSNALKFSHSNSTIVYHFTEDHQSITIGIQDQGIGMGSSTIDSLFKIETRATVKGTHNERGSGLGLILCKEFVENNSGKIWVQSEVSKGTTVHFSVNKPPLLTTVR